MLLLIASLALQVYILAGTVCTIFLSCIFLTPLLLFRFVCLKVWQNFLAHYVNISLGFSLAANCIYLPVKSQYHLSEHSFSWGLGRRIGEAEETRQKTEIQRKSEDLILTLVIE